MPLWVISYDIPNDRRRRRVAAILEGYGRRAQFSVFECDLEADKLTQLERRLKREIHRSEDDVRLYPLNGADVKRIRLLGTARRYEKPPALFVERPRPPRPDDPF